MIWLTWAWTNRKTISVAAGIVAVCAFVGWAFWTADRLDRTQKELTTTRKQLAAEQEAGKLAAKVADIYNDQLAQRLLQQATMEKRIADAMRKKTVQAWADIPIPDDYIRARWGDRLLQPSGPGSTQK